MIDLHVHVLPGIDDGPETLDEALDLCERAHRAGTRTLVATPHLLTGAFPDVTPGKIRDAVTGLSERLIEEGIDIMLLPGAEVRIHPDLPRLAEAGRVLTLGGRGPYLLLEFPMNLVPQGLDRYLFSIQLAGLVPVIAHPERNAEFQQRIEALETCVSAGALLQITAGSLTGMFGKRAERCARSLLDRGMAHLVASDAHGQGGRTPELTEARRLVERTLGPAEADAVFRRRPVAILAGDHVEVPPIRRKRKRGMGLISRWLERGV